MSKNNKQEKDSKKEGEKAPDPLSGFAKAVAFVIFAVVIIAGIAAVFAKPTNEQKQVVNSATNTAQTGPKQDVALADLASLISQGQIKTLHIKGQKLVATSLDEKITYNSKKEPESTLVEQLGQFGVTPDQLKSISLDVKDDSGFVFWLGLLLPFLGPLFLVLFLVWMLSGQIKNSGGMKALSFGQSKARMSDPDKKQVTFADVAGNEEAKEELSEVVDFLKFPKKYVEIGAKIPKGVLLAGDPGTGKTLLARAVAGEAGVPFFHLSGSEFVEMFVGVGASRVRDLFDQAKKVAPAIVFIDEIDAVGRHRGVGIGGGNDEREQTLNQILVEMDGFEPTEAVIVIAATNRADVLDEALLRPGRFDRRVILTAPDKKDRIKILEIHGRNKKMDTDINFEVIAARTPGFSGADLESLMNEAAIKAARVNRQVISQSDLVASIEKVMMGPERKSHVHTPEERELVAYHEAGHAVLASILPEADPVHKVTIIARGYAGGYTLKLPTDERKLKPRVHHLEELVVTLGGMAAEMVMYGDITPGASSDLQNATNTARAMVAKWGMSDVVGPIAIDSLTRASGFGEVGITASQDTLRLVDTEIRGMLEQAKKRALEEIEKHKNLLEAIKVELLEKETLERDEFNLILKKFNVEPKLDTVHKEDIVIAPEINEIKKK